MNLAAYRKTITACVGAAVVTIPLLADGVTNAEWVAILVAWASALGVYSVSNEPLDEGGAANLTTILVVLGIIVLAAYLVTHYTIAAK